MRVYKPPDRRPSLKKNEVTFKSDPNPNKYGNIDGFEIDEALFSLLDGLVENNEKTREIVVKTLMKFALYQPDLVLKSVLTFLQVQKTTVTHQHSLLRFLKRCINELKNIPNSTVKEVLLFVLKEIRFLKVTDQRHLEMKEIVNAATVLCASFSVDIILAYIKEINQRENYFEILCIYVKVLTHICVSVPNNTYVKSILISSHIMSLYNKEVFKEENQEICKELSSLLYAISNMILTVPYTSYSYSRFIGLGRFSSINNKVGKACNEAVSDSTMYEALNLENNICNRLLSKTNLLNRSHDSVNSVNSVDNKMIRKMSRPNIENIKNILEPLYGLMLDYYLQKIYINPAYDNTCLELLYSLVIISEYVSPECFRNNSLNLLTCIIVRFLNYVPNLKLNDNLWLKLHKINSNNLTNKFVSLFSNPIIMNIDVSCDVPPKFFVYGLRVFLQILFNNNQFYIYTNSHNLCNILFSILVILYNNNNKCLLSYLKDSVSSKEICHKDTYVVTSQTNSNDSNNEIDNVYIDHIISSLGILLSINSTCLVLCEFLYNKLTSNVLSSVILSFYIFSCTNEMESNTENNEENVLLFKDNGLVDTTEPDKLVKNNEKLGEKKSILMYKIIDNINQILNINVTDSYSFYIVVQFINTLFSSKYIAFYSNYNHLEDKNTRINKKMKNVYYIINYIFEYKINMDIKKRIDSNLELFSDNKFDQTFFHLMYHYDPNSQSQVLTTHPLVQTEYIEDCIENIMRNAPEHFLSYLMNKLTSNVKRNLLTIFIYLFKLFERCEEDLIRKVLGEDNLVNLLILAMIYLHDPVYYFGEAYYSSKLLIKLYKLLFVPVGTEVSLSNLLIDESVVVNDLDDYNTLDSCFLTDNVIKNSRMDENYVYPTDIVINMMNVSRIIGKLNEFYSVEGDKIINQMSSLIKKLKNKPVLHKSTSFLFSPSFLTTGNTFSSNIVLSNSANTTTNLKVNGIVIDTDLSVFQNLGILNIVCFFTFGSTKKQCDTLDNGVIDIINSVINNVTTNTSSFTLSKEELTLAQRQKVSHTQYDTFGTSDQSMFWCNSVEMKNIYLILNSICISNLANKDNTKLLCTKLYQITVQNMPKDTSFSIFGKTSTYLQSERARLTLLSALTHVYSRFGSVMNTKVVDGGELENSKESVEEALSSRYNKMTNSLLGKEKANETDDNGTESMVEKYIITPLIFIFNNETDAPVQEFILNRLILLTHSNKAVEGDIEMISVLFNKLIGIILKLADSNNKLDANSLAEKYEKNETLNTKNVNIEVNEKEQLLAFYSFLLLSSFGPHYKSLTSSEKPYMVLYHVLYWCDHYFYVNIAKFNLNYSFTYNFHSSINSVKIVQFYLKTVFYTLVNSGNNVDWEILYKIIIIILNNNNQNEQMLIKNRLYIFITFLNEVSHLGYTELSKEDIVENWLKILMMIWCYVLKCHDYNVKIKLINIFYRLFQRHKGVVNEDKVGLEVINNLDTIVKLMPEDLSIKLVMLSANYLERPTCISNSLIKIIHKILKQNMSLMSTQQIQSILIVVFNRFKQHFQSSNIPIFLRLFLIDIFKSNTNILFNVLFGYNLEFQSNVILMIIKDEELLYLLLDYLQQFISKQLQECFKNDSGSVGDVENSISNSQLTRENNIKTLECVIEYNVGIFKNYFELLSESEYVNLLIIYVNAMSNRVSGLVKENLDKKIVRLLKSILQQDVSTNNTILYYSIGIISSNSKLLNSFLDYLLKLLHCSNDDFVNLASENIKLPLNAMKPPMNIMKIPLDIMKVLLRIIIELIKCNLLTGYDLKVLKIIKSLDYNYKLIYYYLKNMFRTRINPYYNLYNNFYSRVEKVRRRFFDQLVTTLVDSVDEKIERDSLYYYLKVIYVVITIITKKRLVKYYDDINKMIFTIVKNKVFFTRKKLRHSYLQLYCSILRYISVNKNSVKSNKKLGMDNLKTYLLYPTCVSIMSKDSKGLPKICNRYMKLFVSVFFGNCYKVDCTNLFEEVIRALIVKGNSNSTCICNSTIPSYNHDNNKLKLTSEPIQKTLCVCNSFYLLYILSYFIPNDEDEGISVPANINEEFKNIKRLQLDKKSSEVLFQSKPSFENHSQDFIDVNEFYHLNLNVGNPSSTQLDGVDLWNISVCGDLLVLLDVSDYFVVDGRTKSNFMYNSDSLEEYFTKASGKNLSLLRIKSLDLIKNSFLFLSSNIYRFITFQKYLNSKPIKVTLFQSDDYFFFNSSYTKANEVVDNKSQDKTKGNDKTNQKPSLEVIQDDVLYNCIKFCVFIISKSSLFISENSEFFQLDHLLDHRDDQEFESNLKLIRRNCLIHFESLCNVVLSKLCKLIDNTKFKLYIYKQLQHLSNVVPH
uniref:Uncharacterized protein n=1 Tax=Theileria annulata TaxID=5874 RepID=A0A3B0MV27_THEAN